MARFASQYRNYKVGTIRPGSPERLGHDGNMIPEIRALGAEFEHRLTEKRDVDAVITKMGKAIHGQLEYPTGEKVPIYNRISVFDSEIAQRQNGWTDEERVLVEEALRNHAMGTDYIEVEQAPADKPWNGFDELTDPERILELALAIDADLRLVLRYEEENQKRPEVLDALQDAIDSGEEAVIVSA